MTTGNVPRCVGCGTPWTHHGIGCAPSVWGYAQDKDAEIARLRAELDAAKAESLGHENAAYGHRSDTQEARAEINEAIQQAHLILDHYAPPECTDRPTTLSSALTQIDGVMLATQRALSSARAALDKEREACDEARRLVGVPNPFDPKWREDMRAWCDRYSARRAAEAKEPHR